MSVIHFHNSKFLVRQKNFTVNFCSSSQKVIMAEYDTECNLFICLFYFHILIIYRRSTLFFNRPEAKYLTEKSQNQ